MTLTRWRASPRSFADKRPFMYRERMRALLFSLLLLTASGCRKNHELLLDRQAELDRRLAEGMELADNLNEHRKEIEVLEREVTAALDDVPEARDAVARLDDQPLVHEPLTGPPTPLPPESAFEGATGTQLRLRIADTERRLVQLSKVLGEVERLKSRKLRLQQELEFIKRVRAERK
jgi:hypothetical protein